MDYTGTTAGLFICTLESAFVMSNGDVVAEPTSRITTVYPTHTDVVELSQWQLGADLYSLGANSE
ncbi:hypothetical protein OK016_27135 [Vibrio chagasii]|nr:hypothetical protein [Vibrio chagasii]